MRALMLDECHLLWGNILAYVWGKTKERIEVPILNTRTRQTDYGSVDYLTGKVLSLRPSLLLVAVYFDGQWIVNKTQLSRFG